MIYSERPIPSLASFSPVVQATVKQFGDLLEEVVDFSNPDERGNWFFASDTGTGKTTAMMWHLARNNSIRVVVAVPTQLAAEQVFAQLRSWKADVAVWTGAHDKYKREKVDFTPSEYFERNELKNVRIVIGTHQFVLSGRKEIKGWLGPRDLLIIDEVPVVFEGASQLSLTNICRAWEEANAVNSQLSGPLRRLRDWAEDLADRAASGKQHLSVELAEEKDDWVDMLRKADTLETSSEAKRMIREVIGFVLASFEGRAFVQLRDGGGQVRTIFCTTEMKLPYVPRAIHLSATVHLEGWQVSPYKENVRMYRGSTLDYCNLKIFAAGWPKTLPLNYNDLTRSPDSISRYKDFVAEALDKTPREAKVLIVVPKALMGHTNSALYAAQYTHLRSTDDVRVTHFKVDVGSNEYADCSDVILVGLHHAPKTAHMQKAFQYSQIRVTQPLLDQQMGSLQDIFAEVRADEYKAQIKQLGARGRVRVANKDGSCGSMRLWIYQDRVFPEEIQSLFPGANIDFDPSAYNNRHGVPKGHETFKTKVLNGLKSLPLTTQEIEVEQLGELIGEPNLKTRGTRLADSNAAWTMLGWSFVPGTKGRGGTKARFVRTERPSSLAA